MLARPVCSGARVDGARRGAASRGLLPSLLALLGSLAACRPAPAPAPPIPLRIAHEAPLVSLDPVAGTDSIARSVLSNFYDALVDYDEVMRPVPALALSWSSPDEHTWLLPLRPNVRAHDGGTLTPEDVRFSLERARTAPESALKDRLVTVESIELVEGPALRIRTVVPDPILLERLADIFIAPERAAPTLGTRPDGTGPYRCLEAHAGTLEAESFPACWRGRPRVETVRFLPVSGAPAVALFEHGGLDLLRSLPESRVAEIRALPGARVEARHGLRAMYLWMRSLPSPKGPFADARVRRAMSLAIDRDALVARLGGGALPLKRFFPPGVVGYAAPKTPLTYGPDEARRLLGDSGHERGFATDLVFAEGHDALVEIIAPMLQAVGIEARPRALPWTEMLPLWQGARLPLFVGSWLFSSGDASLFLKECLGTRPRGLENAWNPGYSDPKLDALIAEDFRIFGTPARIRHSELLVDYLMSEMPLVPLVNREDLYAVRSRVRWKPRLDARLLVAEMALE